MRSITRDQLREYITTHYTAPRMIVVGAGALEHQRLVEMADKCFGNLPRDPPPGSVVTVRDRLRCNFSSLSWSYPWPCLPTGGIVGKRGACVELADVHVSRLKVVQQPFSVDPGSRNSRARVFRRRKGWPVTSGVGGRVRTSEQCPRPQQHRTRRSGSMTPRNPGPDMNGAHSHTGPAASRTCPSILCSRIRPCSPAGTSGCCAPRSRRRTWRWPSRDPHGRTSTLSP